MMAPWRALSSLQGGRATSELKPIIAIDLAPAGKPAANLHGYVKCLLNQQQLCPLSFIVAFSHEKQ